MFMHMQYVYMHRHIFTIEVVSVLTGVTGSLRVRNIYTGSDSLGLDVKIN